MSRLTLWLIGCNSSEDSRVVPDCEGGGVSSVGAYLNTAEAR